MGMPAAKLRQNLSSDTTRSRSPNIWSDCPYEQLRMGEINGVAMHYDFNEEIPYLTTPTITTQAALGAGLKAFGSAGSTLVSGGGAEGGTFVGTTAATDNLGVNFAAIALPFKIIRTYGSFWWEIRLKRSTVATLDAGIFVGLMEQLTYTVTAPIAAAGTMTDNNFVGFHNKEATATQCDTVYKADGVTQVSASSQLGTALAADTYTKLGMRYNHRDYSFRFYQNNLELTTSYTIPSAAGTDFPNDVFMGLCVAELNGASAVAEVVTIDWIRAAQCYDLVP